MNTRARLACAFVIATACAFAQTTIPSVGAVTPTGSFDASNATSSKPMKQGTSLPASCTVGDQFFKTDATAGQNLYGCTSASPVTWSLQAGGGSGGGASITGTDAQLVVKSGTNGVTRGMPCFTNDGSNIVHDGTCFAGKTANNTFSGTNDFSTGALTPPKGTTPPATCTVGQVFFDSDATPGSNWFGCTSASPATWTLLGGGGSGSVTSVTVPVAYYHATMGTTPSTQTHGGGFALPSTGGATASSAGTVFRTGWFAFPDAVDTTVFFETRIHPNWNGGTITIVLDSFPGSGGTTGQVARILTSYACLGAGDIGGSTEPAWTTFQDTGITMGSSGAISLSSLSNAVAGCEAGDRFYFRIIRDGDGTAGTDSLAANFDLKGLSLQYTITAAQ